MADPFPMEGVRSADPGQPNLAQPGDAQHHLATSGSAIRARIGAWLFVVAAVVVAAPAGLPGSGQVDSTGLLAVSGVLLASAAVLASVGHRLAATVFPALTLAACGLVAAAVYLHGHGDTPTHDELVFLLISLYAAYFYGRRMVTIHLGVIAVLYGAALGIVAPQVGEAANWMLSIGTFAVAAMLIRLMKERLDSVIERLAAVARTDSLTGLLNRRGFIERFEYELELARRSGRPLSLLVGDLDRFKELNDRYGHPAGDDALAKVGKILDTTRRRIDTAGRVGGEEFALICPFTDAKGAVAVADRVRSELAELFGTAQEGKPGRRGAMPVTISFGIVHYPTHGQSVEALMHVADRALHTAKRQGRNRAVVYRPDRVPQYAGPPVAPVPE